MIKNKLNFRKSCKFDILLLFEIPTMYMTTNSLQAIMTLINNKLRSSRSVNVKILKSYGTIAEYLSPSEVTTCSVTNTKWHRPHRIPPREMNNE
jgi:hypothetical protein